MAVEKILVTGGAGFIGSNTVDRFAGAGIDVQVIDNLSRPNTSLNRDWLLKRHPENIRFHEVDIRDRDKINLIVRGFKPDAVYHLAGQVAVTISVEHPMEDFEINALGTLHLLEAVREHSPEAVFVFSSTNKVYGDVKIPVSHRNIFYVFDYPEVQRFGLSEATPLDFYSPYGCSKGAADQYVNDYARTYGMNTVVLRQSCIYGPRQFGTEDQGWVMHFVRKALAGDEITIFGDGKQVRDILHIDDLVRLYETLAHIGENDSWKDRYKGKIYNVGGGPDKKFSLLTLIGMLEQKLSRKINYNFADWRTGDQKIYVSDIRKVQQEIGWLPSIGVDQGVDDLIDWAKSLS